MCEPVAGAHAVPSLFVKVLYRGIKMSSVRCALRRMRFASLMSLLWIQNINGESHSQKKCYGHIFPHKSKDIKK